MTSPVSGGHGGMDIPDLSVYTMHGSATAGATDQTAAPQTTQKIVPIQDTVQQAEGGTVQAEGYQAPASTPALSPTVTVPASMNDIPPTDADQKQELIMQMVAKLPPTLRTQLMKDMAKPPEQRDPQLVALEANLSIRAKQQIWAQGIMSGQPIPPQPTTAAAAQTTTPAPTPTPSPAPTPAASTTAPTTTPAVPATAGTAQTTPSMTLGQIEAIKPSAMTSDQISSVMSGNALDTLQNQTKVIQSTVESLPPNDPNRPILMDFLKFIANIIDECKQFLHELTAKDADMGRKAALAMKSVQEDKLNKQLEDVKKAAQMKQKANTLKTVMMIAGPIIAIAMVAMVIVSGGSLIEIAIAVILAVVAVVAATTGIVDQIVKQIMDEIKSVLMKLGLSETEAAIITAVIVIVAIIALMVVTDGACTELGDVGGMVASQLAEEDAEEVAAQTTSDVATAMAMDVGATCVSHSNVIEYGLKPFLTNVLGMDEKTAELICMVTQMIVMLSMALAGASAMADASQAVAQSEAGTMGKTLENIADQLKQFSTAVQLITQAYSAIANLQLAEMSMSKAKLQQMITEINTAQDVQKQWQKALDKSDKGLSDLAAFYSSSFSQLIGSMQRIVSQLT